MQNINEPVYPPDPLAGRYAGFWMRVAAACIDLVLYAPLYYAVKAVFGREYNAAGEVVFFLIGLFTYAAFFASRFQASPGMWIVGFHVTDEQGGRIHYGRAVKWGIISGLGMALCCISIFYMEYRFDMSAIHQMMKSCDEMNLRMEDCMAEAETTLGVPYQTFAMMAVASLLLTVFLLLIWVLSVVLAKDKAGFHNLVCHTRFIKGRPGA